METTEKYCLVGDELIGALLAHFPINTPLHFQKEENMMKALWLASKKPEYTQLFEMYRFNEDGAWPYCIELAVAVRELHHGYTMATRLAMPYRFLESDHARFKKIIAPKLNATQTKQLILLAKEMQRAFLAN